MNNIDIEQVQDKTEIEPGDIIVLDEGITIVVADSGNSNVSYNLASLEDGFIFFATWTTLHGLIEKLEESEIKIINIITKSNISIKEVK